MHTGIFCAIGKLRPSGRRKIPKVWVRLYIICLLFIPIVLIAMILWESSWAEVQKCRDFLNASREVQIYIGALTHIHFKRAGFHWSSTDGDSGHAFFAVKSARKKARLRVDWEGSVSGLDFKVIKVSEVDSWSGEEIAVVWKLTLHEP